MLGNCATGKLTMVTAPTITIRIAITITTMGRLMKNLDMRLGSFQSNDESSPLRPCRKALRAASVLTGKSLRHFWVRRRSWPSLGHKWLGLDDHAREESLLALRDNTFTELQSVLDNPHGANAVSNLDRADGDPVVLSDDVNLIAALQLRDCRLGNQ